MALTAAELRAVYSVDEGPLDKSLSGMGGKVESTFGKVAAAAAGFFAFDKLQEGFFSVTGAASDLNETINKADTIFGSNAAAISSWAKGAAQNLGLSRQQALDAAAGFGDMFSQIGFAGDQAANMSKSVVQMSADLGSFNNLPTEDVAQRLSAAFRGEYDSLQALIPNINAARVESEAMAATGKKNASELTAQEKAAAVLAIVNKDGARAMGDFAKTSDGAANASKIATAEWEDQKAAIGQQLLPILTALIGYVRSDVIPAVGKLADFIANNVVPALKGMAEWVQANQTPVKIIAGLVGGFLVAALSVWAARTVLSAATNTLAWFTTAAASRTSAAGQSKSAAQVVAGWLLMATKAAINGLKVAAVWTAQIVASAAKGAAAFLLQVGRVVGGWALMAAQAVIHGAKQGAVWTAQVVAAAVKGAISFGIQVALVVGGWVLMGVQSLIQAGRMAAAWFIALGPVGWVIAAVGALVGIIIANWDTVVSWTKTAWEAVTGALSAAWEWIKGIVSGAVGVVAGAVQAAWDWIRNTTVSVWDSVTAAISAAWNWITGIVGGAVAVVSAVISGVWNWVKSATSTAWNAVAGAVSTGVGNVISFVQSLPGRIMGAIGNLGSLLLNAGRDLLSGLWNGIQAAAGWLWGKVKSFFGSLLPGWVKDMLGIHSPSTVFAEMGRYLMLGMASGIEDEQSTAVKAAERAAAAITDAMAVSAPDLSAMANQQAMVGLTARRPTGTTAAAASTPTSGDATSGDGGPRSLFHADSVTVIEGTPDDVARQLELGARTRGNW